MFCLNAANQYQYNTMRISSVVAYLTRTVTGSSPGQANFVLFHAAMFLFYIIQKTTVPNLCIFRKYITTHQYITLL
jgi:hypothetical protein